MQTEREKLESERKKMNWARSMKRCTHFVVAKSPLNSYRF